MNEPMNPVQSTEPSNMPMGTPMEAPSSSKKVWYIVVIVVIIAALGLWCVYAWNPADSMQESSSTATVEATDIDTELDAIDAELSGLDGASAAAAAEVSGF
jgi:hypothetical protein